MVDFQMLFDRMVSPPQPVNIWALRKAPSVKSLLLRLSEYLGQGEWIIDTSMRTNRDAVYLVHTADEHLRAYLHIHGQAPGQAGLHLEFPAVDGNGPTFEAYEALEFSRLADMLATHFGVSNPSESR